MDTEKQKEIKVIKTKLLKVQLLGIPGAIALGLGLYGMFVAEGQAFHPFLNDQANVRLLIVIGVAIQIWEFLSFIPLVKKRAKLEQRQVDPGNY